MANSYKTVAEIASINGEDFSDGQFSDVLNDAPVIASIPAVTSSKGNVHQYRKTTAAPVVGYVGDGVGRDLSKSTKIAVTADLEALDASFAVPVHVANASNAEDVVQGELIEHLAASMFAFESQLINGTIEGDAAGHEGLANQANAVASSQFVNATGSTVGAQTSVYMVRFSEMDGVAAVIHPEITVGTTIVQDMLAANGKSMPHYYTPLQGYNGVQVGTNYSTVRIGNLNDVTDSKGLTDDLLSAALEKFPAGKQPNRILMSRLSLGQLQRSRTTYSPTGTPAPRPTEYEGIPITVTDAIIATEAVVA
tara:strand:- start:740 stop:1666 length:927 start_codon:yes stop_codon:yes gene_type:complete